MAKYKRSVVGSVVKSKDPTRPNYIKFKTDCSFANGQMVSVESKAFQLQSLASAVANGKLTPENAEKAKERIEKIPAFVLGELVVVEKLD